jgi:hypothetical protein
VVLLVTTRMGLWMGVQLGLAGLVILAGTADAPGHALEAVAGWWMVYGVLVDLGTLGVIGWLLGRDGGSYRGLLGPPTTIGQVAVGALGVLAVSVPAVVFSSQLTSGLYGQAMAPLFAVVNLPPWAGLVAVVVVPLVAELAEPVAYLGVVLPRAGTAPGPLLAGRRHRGRPVGGRAWPVSSVGQRRPAGLGVGGLSGGVGAAVPGRLDRGLLCPGTAAAAGHGGALGHQHRHRPRPHPHRMSGPLASQARGAGPMRSSTPPLLGD